MKTSHLRIVVLAALTFGSIVPVTAGAGPARLVSTATRTPLPSDRLHFGLASSPGSDLNWFIASGVPWRYRYQYLAGGINVGGAAGDPCGANNGWQTWNSNPDFATRYIADSVAHSAIPVFTYYEIVQSNPSPGNESTLPTKVQTLCTMQRYWADFTVLMQKVGAYAGQVVVHVEPDFWGFMEHQSSDPSTILAVVASSGNPDLAGLPNTVQGMGWAFLKLRDKYAPNALLAIHASSWGSGVDIAGDQRSTIDANTEADKVAAFLNKAGIIGNPTGVTPWDLVFNDVADHDAGSYGALSNNHWWDRNNVLFPNFSRWLVFMSRLHADTGRPLVGWQVPVGNQYYQTMNNMDGHYQDNRVEYFLAHPSDLTAAGIVAVLFGKANGGQTTYTDFKGDSITNPSPVVSWQCNLCNNHVSSFSDDDGGYLRVAVGAYYAGSPLPTPCAVPGITAAPLNAQVAGNPVLVTATTSGCSNPQYRFWLRTATGPWTLKQDYSSSNTWNWTQTGTGGSYFIGVHVRAGGSGVPFDNVASLAYSITTTLCSSVTLTPAPGPAQVAGTPVVFTAAAGGCPSPRYEFWMRSSTGPWQMVQAYSGSATFSWSTSGLFADTYYFGVWAKDAGSPTSSFDINAAATYRLNPASCAAVSVSASPPSAAHSNLTQVTFTATASGCTHPSPLYEFWYFNGSAWFVVRGWSSSASWVWNTSAPAGTYTFGVWVRDAASPGLNDGGSMGRFDTYAGVRYSLS